ncbi:prealbumin-like fold domain-containing protein [Weissella confusa]|uniref:MSCRAMM family protein n=1 Tax=Weissella confusa TaxID=1583 RepID=UPI001C114481|nr:SpaA isopeptide-forming pilin-related protein [Weissella confusa]MBU5284751.1 prealbumin-like fold domain-containing protein [Weissella confusa]
MRRLLNRIFVLLMVVALVLPVAVAIEPLMTVAFARTVRATETGSDKVVTALGGTLEGVYQEELDPELTGDEEATEEGNNGGGIVFLNDMKTTGGNINTFFKGVAISATVKQRRAYFDYKVTFTPEEDAADSMLVMFNTHDRVGDIVSKTINGKELCLDSNDFARIDLTSGKQTVDISFNLPEDKTFARMLIILFEEQQNNHWEAQRIDTGIIYEKFATEQDNRDALGNGKQLDIYETQAERETLLKPADLVPNATVKGYKTKIDPDAYSNADDMQIYLNRTAVNDKYLFIEERYNATSKKSIANLWGLDDKNVEKGLYYFDQFNEEAPGKNYGVMVSVVDFDEAAARDAELTVYYPYVGTYSTKENGKWVQHKMGAYVTLSDFMPGTLGGASGGEGDNVAPFLYLSNNLYSGLVYNKLADFHVKFEFVTAKEDGPQCVIDVTNEKEARSSLTLASLNDHKYSNPYGNWGDGWRSYAESVGWVTGDRNKTNLATVVDDTSVARFGTKYIGSDDTVWTDRLGGAGFERSALSFGLDGTFGTISLGSNTNGVWHSFMTSKLDVPADRNFGYAADLGAATIDRFGPEMPDGNNNLSNQELPDDQTSLWYWLYPDTYDNRQDFLIAPTGIVVEDTLPMSTVNGETDRMTLDFPYDVGEGNMPDVVKVYGTNENDDRRLLREFVDYRVWMSKNADGHQVVTITFTTAGASAMIFNGETWAIGLKVKHAIDDLQYTHSYENKATVAYNYDDTDLNRKSTSNPVVHYRRGESDETANVMTHKFGIHNVGPDGEALSGATFELTDATGNVVEANEDLNGKSVTWLNLPDGKYKLRQTGAANMYWRDQTEHEIVIENHTAQVDGDLVPHTDSGCMWRLVNEPTSVRLQKLVGENFTPTAGATYMVTSTSNKEYYCPIPLDGRELPKLKRGVYRINELTAPNGYAADKTVYYFEVTQDGVVSTAEGAPVGTAPLPEAAQPQKVDGKWHIKVHSPHEQSIFPRVGGSGVVMFWVVPGMLLLISGGMSYRQRRQ